MRAQVVWSRLPELPSRQAPFDALNEKLAHTAAASHASAHASGSATPCNDLISAPEPTVNPATAPWKPLLKHRNVVVVVVETVAVVVDRVVLVSEVVVDVAVIVVELVVVALVVVVVVEQSSWWTWYTKCLLRFQVAWSRLPELPSRHAPVDARKAQLKHPLAASHA